MGRIDGYSNIHGEHIGVVNISRSRLKTTMLKKEMFFRLKWVPKTVVPGFIVAI